ncbi:MAG: N-acetyltransferase family protein [Acidimicrobiales bacterium]
MNLRQAAESDLDSLLTVQEEGATRALSHIFPQDTHPFPRETLRSRWVTELADPGIRAYVITNDDDEVLGFAATRDDELLHFGTAVETWGTGVAAAAHDALLRTLADQGVTQARLRVFEENHRARRFYEKLGWQPTEQRSRTSFPPHPVLVEYRRHVP